MAVEKSISVNVFSATDLYGGAGIAAYRLHRGLTGLSVSSRLVVQDKQSIDSKVIGPTGLACKLYSRVLSHLDPVPKLFYPKRFRGAWSCGFLPNPCLSTKQLNAADLIHLHWINGGMLPIRTMRKLSRPVIWTLHDSWPFTGGCHIPFDCRQFEGSCGNCPQLNSLKEQDLSRRIWQLKLNSWQNLPMAIVAPSRWLAELATASSLFKDRTVEVIPNGIDTNFYHPLDKADARRRLGLPENARLLLFSAAGGVANWNKGSDLLVQGLLDLIKNDSAENLFLVLSGSRKSPPTDYYPVPVIDLGWVENDEMKRAIYTAVDVTVAPSRSESLGYVVMESMSCGTPCVSFSVGGVLDLIDHGISGYLAQPFATDDFAKGILMLFENMQHAEIKEKARDKILKYCDQAIVSQRYLELYQRVLRDVG